MTSLKIPLNWWYKNVNKIKDKKGYAPKTIYRVMYVTVQINSNLLEYFFNPFFCFVNVSWWQTIWPFHTFGHCHYFKLLRVEYETRMATSNLVKIRCRIELSSSGRNWVALGLATYGDLIWVSVGCCTLEYVCIRVRRNTSQNDVVTWATTNIRRQKIEIVWLSSTPPSSGERTGRFSNNFFF